METESKIKKRKNSQATLIKIVVPVVALMVIAIIATVVMLVLSENSAGKKRKQVITMLKPPPPPEKIEKPPEPEIKKEEILEPEPEDEAPDDSDAPEDDSSSVDDLLGLDSDATGVDGFGLKAKKGARSILGSGDSKFRWYTSMVQKKISENVQYYLKEKGIAQDSTLKTLIRVVIDDDGRVVSFTIIRSSGNETVDKAVLSALEMTDIDEIPPYDMPRAMKFRITSKGKNG